MASINEVTIDLKFTGLDNLEQATKKMRQVQTEVKRLAKEEKAGAIDTGQYATRVGDLAAELQKVTGKHKQTADAVFAYSRAVKSSIAESERQKAVLAENAKFQKSLTEAKRVAASVSALNKQRMAEENAMLKQAQPAMEAYNRSLLGTDKAVKSAKASADVFAADIKRQETALKQAQPAMEAYNRSLLGTDRAVKSAKASADAFKPMLDALDQDAKMAAQAAEEYNRALLGTDKAQKSARASADVFKEAIKANELATEQSAQATREAAAADAALQAEKDRLIQKLNPLRSASMLYEKELNDINEATRLGVINDRQRQQSLDALNAEFQAYNAGVQGAAMANNRFAVQGQQAKRQTNQLGVLLQQTGYQVGDFAVQVQSGTNVMVALGQQATQLVGTFGMLSKSTRMIGLFAGLGVAIPILTAIAGAFMRVNETASSTAQDIENSFSDLKGFFDDLGASISTAFDDAFTEIEQKYGQLFERLAQIRLRETKGALTTSFAEVVPQTVEPGFMERLGAALAPGMVGTSAEALKIVQDRTDALYEESRAVAEIQRNYMEQVESAQSLQDIINLTVDTESKLAAISNDAADAFVLQAEKAGITREMLDGSKDSYDDILGSAEGLAAATEALNQLTERSLAEQEAYEEQVAKIRRIMGQVGAETVGVTEGTIRFAQAMGGTIDDAIRLQAALDSGQISASLLGETDISKGLNPAVDLAKNLAKQLDISFRLAAAMAGAIARGADEVQLDPRSPRYDPAAARAARMREMMESGELYRGLPTPSDGTSGGGAGAADEFASRVLSGELMEAIQRAQEETALYEKEVKMLDSALTNGLITQQEYNSYVLQAKEAYGQAAEGAKEYENANLILANTMSDALGDALMSVVDGTKSASDAFSDMARIIIKKAFEMAVINPILNSIFGGVSGFNLLPTFGSTSANGNVFSGGNVIPFANGGVVGGPTTFPMANGQTGLMGEAGPEAIMPLKRGKDGKLGVTAEGGGNVVIHQTFQFSANGDDSVKRIIAQEAPKIANLTQKQIMDQRRRGGAMKATFG